MIVGVIHNTLQMQLHVIFYLWGYVKDQVYVPPLPATIPVLKVRIRTAIETITADMLQTVGTNIIIVLMFVESQRVHIQSICNVRNKTWSVVLLNKKNTYSCFKCFGYDKLLKPRQSFRIILYISSLKYRK